MIKSAFPAMRTSRKTQRTADGVHDLNIQLMLYSSRRGDISVLGQWPNLYYRDELSVYYPSLV